MSSDLSPNVEQKIAEALASGLYPSRQAMLEAGIERLLEEPSLVPDEHLEAVENAIAQLDAGLGVEWNVEDEIRKLQAKHS